MSENTAGNSRYLKRKLDLHEADNILESIIKSRKEPSEQAEVDNTHPQSSSYTIKSSETPSVFIPIDISSAAGQSTDHQFQNLINQDDVGENDDGEYCSQDDELHAPRDDGLNLNEKGEITSMIREWEDCSKAVYLPLLCLAFKLKYFLSKAAFEDHLRIVQIATNSSVDDIRSASKCMEKYKYLKQQVKKVYVCMQPKCNAVLSTGNDDLPTRNQPCGHPYNRNRGSCYFLTLPIEEQLRCFLERGGMKKREIVHRYDGSTRGDVQSGTIYREKINPTASETIISLQLNTDGAQIFKSSKFSFWPLMGLINEVPYRSKRSNMILMSLWYGNKKPPKCVFLESTVKELQKLGNEGILFNETLYQVKPSILSTDTMARAVFLDCIQFNGEYGCDFCLHPGEQIKKGKGSKRIYPEPAGPPYLLRTLEQHSTDLETLSRTGKTIHGINGPSLLGDITDFDYVKAQVPDYLHSCLHGVIKFLLSLWTDTTNSKEPWYLDADKRATLNSRLLEIRPPYDVTRTSRSIYEMAFWKASEFRAFALYYFPTLLGLLPDIYYNHFLSLSYGLQVLLQEEVDVNMVKDTKVLFQDFVKQFEKLYRRENVRFNVHLFTHLCDSALDWGCLWASSTFIPEWFNGQLVSMANGTQNVAEQMAHTFLLRQVIREEAIELMSRYLLPANVSSLLCSLLHIPTHLNGNLIEKENLFVTPSKIELLGLPIKTKTSLACEIALNNYLKEPSLESESIGWHYVYQRFLLPTISSIFTSTNYTRSPKRLNDCAFMLDGTFFIIEAIMHFSNLPLDNQPFIIGRSMGSISNVKCCPLPVLDKSFSKLSGQSTHLVGLSKSLKVYSANDISKKCVLVPIADSLHPHSYVVTALPNSLETD